MWSSLCVVFLGFSAWAVSWLPVLPTLLHPSPAVLLLHLVWRCHRVSGCPLCLQSYHQQERTLGSSRRQEPICPTLERLTSVTANAKVNVSFSFCKTKVFLNVSNGRFFYAEVFPIQMEGVRLTVNKGLSNHFQVSQCVSSAHSHVSVQLIWPFFSVSAQVNHTLMLSTMDDSSYRFGTTYVGSKQMGPAEVGWVIGLVYIFIFISLLDLSLWCSVFSSYGWRHGQQRQPERSDHPSDQQQDTIQIRLPGDDIIIANN